MNNELTESYDYCQRLARSAAKNFYYSFLTLPRDRFRAMCVLYAFLRLTDDIGDNAEIALTERVTQLADWREKLSRACEQREFTHPCLPALADIVNRFQIDSALLHEVVIGVESDLQEQQFPTFAELETYCYRVAGVVGLCCISIWGFHDERAKPAAVACGTAFQLTNILRDIAEDAGLGRVYLPQEDLDRFSYSRDDIRQQVRDERFHELMRFEVERAEAYYGKANELFDYLDPPGRAILAAMIGIYGDLLQEIRRREFDIFSERVRLSRRRKLMWTARSWWRYRLLGR